MTAFSAVARSDARELMDEDSSDFETFRGCLVDLARINRLSLGYRPTVAFLDRLRRERRLPQGRPLRILDVGCGYGDTLRAVDAWARRVGAPVALLGIDRNPWAERAARAATEPAAPIAFRTVDLFDFRPDGPIDVVLSALFAHHLDDRELTRFLRWQEKVAGVGWHLNDLRRSRLAFHGFRAASAALRMHRFVRHDGPVSFARAFVKDDWRRALGAAGVPEGAARIARQAPFRLCVSRVKP
ncbi:methyltransferase domain-containing protein [Hansschlegelia sp.]|uniref:methyltransferase domain-containing protein n=1 Tax=Hansschlegelia sp. TaxID=2041892 RepID=UPI002C5C6D49|nr:methyltransferase domain-containing protein [Hansschlegelia sp.]HVI30126.1 methyltransferase domain-containing protein [Hansschlegelia sp.]